MRRILLFTLLILALPVAGRAQTTSTGKHAVHAGTDTVSREADSVLVTRLRAELAEAQQEQERLRTEVGLLIQPIAADSAARAARRQRIDSLRRTTPGYPVVVEGDTLYRIYAKRGGYSPEARARMNAGKIDELGRRLRLNPDSLAVEHSDIVSDVVYGGDVIASFTDQDGLWAGLPREQLAETIRERVAEKLRVMHELYGWIELAKRIALFVLLVVGQWLLIRVTNWLFRRGRKRICRRRSRLKPIRIQSYELFDAYKQVRVMLFASHMARYVVIMMQLLISVPLLFAIFPGTRTLAYEIVSYIWTPFRGILVGMLEYIPNLFTIAVIWLVTRYAVRGIRYLADEIHAEKLKIGGFYPEWAIPTFQIVRFLLYAFMVAMIYPYLPGYDSDVFKGISVFVGLIISLGSSTVVGNILAGLVITYMRPFRLGDRIKLNDTVGKVIEKTAFVTRLRTPKNEVVTIPNSFIMSSHTVNYSASAREYGLLIHTEVTIGYDTPWRKVHRLLIEAAEATPGIVPHPEPFVLETSLSDYYPVYQLNACIRDADRMVHIQSVLHQHIQDKFAAEGVEIMSPAYTAVRNGNASTVPDPEEKN